MRKTVLLSAFTVVALAACSQDATSPVASARPALAVTYDASTGTGFVGKGDVQLAFGWNNQQLQSNAGGVRFSYNTTDKYTAVCTFTTGEGTRGEKTHDIDHKRTTTVASSVAYDARVRNQITGFTLTGLRETTPPGGEIPVVGGACMGNQGHDGTWTSVELTGASGGLFVHHAARSSLLQ
jgi:hypothetical protein